MEICLIEEDKDMRIRYQRLRLETLSCGQFGGHIDGYGNANVVLFEKDESNWNTMLVRKPGLEMSVLPYIISNHLYHESHKDYSTSLLS
jgi:hypothetical protein